MPPCMQHVHRYSTSTSHALLKRATLQAMLKGMTTSELVAMPPFPFPEELLPAGTFPPGVRFSWEGLRGVPPSVKALLGAGDGAALGAMYAEAVADTASSGAAFWLQDPESEDELTSGTIPAAPSEQRVPAFGGTDEKEKRFIQEMHRSQEGMSELAALLQQVPGLQGVSKDDMPALVARMLEADTGTSDDESEDDPFGPSTVRAPEGESARPPTCSSAGLPQQHAAQQANCSAAARSQWLAAAKSGDIDAMQGVLKQDPALLTVQGPGVGHSALHWAAAKGHGAAVHFLLAQPGANVNARNACASTAMHGAATYGHDAAVRALLAHAQCDCTLRNEDGLTAQQLANQRGHSSTVRLLQEHCNGNGGTGNPEPSLADDAARQSAPVASSSTCTGCNPCDAGAADPAQQAPDITSGTEPMHKKAAGKRPPPAQQASNGCPADSASGEHETAGTCSDPPRPDTCQPTQAPASTTGSACADTPSSACQATAGADVLWSKRVTWISLVSSDLGSKWVLAAQQGNVQALKKLRKKQPALLVYRGKGTSYGFCGVCFYCSLMVQTLLQSSRAIFKHKQACRRFLTV
jgi:Ankyrin repeats (many copies)